MPVIIITTQDIFTAAIGAARDASAKILKLSDLNESPLVPGESADMRRHAIAKLGKQLAEAFRALDDLSMENHAHVAPSDVTAGPVNPVDPNTN
jgi:hypothetical protein